MTVQTTGNTDNQERRRKGINLNSVVSNILISFFSDTDDEGDGDDGKPRGEKDKKDGEEKKSKHEINLGKVMFLRRKVDFM